MSKNDLMKVDVFCEKDFELLSNIIHLYKDVNRGNIKLIRDVIDLEKKLSTFTNDLYQSDNTYNV